MADVSEIDDNIETPKKSGKMGLVIALSGALIAGGGGFYATYSGLVGSGGGGHLASGHDGMNFSFVEIEPMLVSLGPRARSQTLKFAAQLEVEPEAADAVKALGPRIVDVLNDFLRAVDEEEMEDPAALGLLRAQMLRRIQTVVGDGKVRDLLIMEFLLT